MNVDELITYVSLRSRDQHGLIRVDQVAADDRRRLRHLVDRGLLERAARGVYRSTSAPVTWDQSVLAGVWALGSNAVASHKAAARLHQFDGYTGPELEFTVGRGQRGRVLPESLGARVHSSVVVASDRRTVTGVPVTSPERTILDLARAGTSLRLLESAVDSALRLRLTTIDVLLARLDTMKGSARWGVARLDDVLFTSGGHSYLERRFLKLVRRVGLPMPQTQVAHRSDGRHIARVDFVFPHHDLVVEVSGGRGHSSAADRAIDATRRNGLQQLGRMVLEFTYEMVVAHESRVLAVLQVAVDARSR